MAAKKHYDTEDVKAILEQDVDDLKEDESKLPPGDFVSFATNDVEKEDGK